MGFTGAFSCKATRIEHICERPGPQTLGSFCTTPSQQPLARIRFTSRCSQPTAYLSVGPPAGPPVADLRPAPFPLQTKSYSSRYSLGPFVFRAWKAYEEQPNVFKIPDCPEKELSVQLQCPSPSIVVSPMAMLTFFEDSYLYLSHRIVALRRSMRPPFAPPHAGCVPHDVWFSMWNPFQRSPAKPLLL